MRFAVTTATAVSALAYLASACGRAPETPAVSQPAERYDMPPDKIPVEEARSFIAHAREIVESPSGTGKVTVREVLGLMPMAESQKAIVAQAYPNDLDVACTDGRCKVSGAGQPVEAVIDATVGPIRNPNLGLKAEVSVEYVLRGPQAIELCNADGLYVKKFVVRKDIQGMALDVAGEPLGIVNLGDDDQNFTCE